MDNYKYRERRNPFPRPWMNNNGLAASGGSSSVLKGLVAGGITGAIEICISYPTEFVKTKLQLDQKSGSEKRYTGFFDVVRKTVKEKGVIGLYRGLGILLIFSIPKIGIRFSSFEAVKSLLVDDKGNLSPASRVISGLGAGISEAVFIVTPMETIKVKFIHDQMLQTPKYKGMFSGVATIVKEEGLRGCYQGLLPTVLKQGSNQAVRFYVVETLKHEYRGGDPTVPIPKPLIGCFGVIAAFLSVLGNNPIDVIKTRMQGLEAKQYKSSVDCAVKVLKNEGILALYKGTLPRVFRVAIDAGFSFMFYETVMEKFNKIWP